MRETAASASSTPEKGLKKAPASRFHKGFSFPFVIRLVPNNFRERSACSGVSPRSVLCSDRKTVFAFLTKTLWGFFSNAFLFMIFYLLYLGSFFSFIHTRNSVLLISIHISHLPFLRIARAEAEKKQPDGCMKKNSCSATA